MHRSAAVACAQVTTIILHFMMVSHNTGWIVTDLICHLPSIIFLIGVTAIFRICQLVPFRFLVGLHEMHQFTLQYLTSLLALNVCLHGIWFNIETFIAFILPRLLDHLITINPGQLWFGFIEIPEKMWTTVLLLLISTSFLAMITPFIHKYERSLGKKNRYNYDMFLALYGHD
uniref:Uncharacterized protein n=1 Tax=Panstrongylus lignarius TaxID=156445 RepID=A0A224XZ71_9HEMI